MVIDVYEKNGSPEGEPFFSVYRLKHYLKNGHPNRSVLISWELKPIATSVFATTSTKPVGPQT